MVQEPLLYVVEDGAFFHPGLWEGGGRRAEEGPEGVHYPPAVIPFPLVGAKGKPPLVHMEHVTEPLQVLPDGFCFPA